jgi:uncharacterized membrane protein
MAGWLPSDSIGGVALANVIVVVGLVLVCFVAGLVARAALLRATVEGLESKVLTKVPGYVLIKGMVSGLKEDEGQSLHPVLATFGAAQRMALEIERLDDGRVVVLVPSSPNPWSGPVHIMDAEDVQRVDIPVTAFVENMQRFGQGTNVLLRSGGELARS